MFPNRKPCRSTLYVGKRLIRKTPSANAPVNSTTPIAVSSETLPRQFT